MKHTFLNSIVFLSFLSLVFTSCIKDDVKDLKDEGDSFIRIAESPENTLYFSLFTDVKKVYLFSLRRDAASSSALNQVAAIQFKLDTASIIAYNEENGTEFELLPDSIYTLGDGITRNGDVYTMNLNAGDFAKDFTVNLNGAKWDVSHKYAMAFNILDSAGLNIKEGTSSIISFISLKNKYQGTYQATGVLHHPTNGDRDINETKELITAGINSVRAPLGDLGGSGYFMILTINPDNTVTITPSGATPNIDQHWGLNYYDPETRTFHLHYSYNTAAPRIIKEDITLQ